MTHIQHATATILTCGLWLPIWALCAVAGLVTPSCCSVCSNPFRRGHHVWMLDGRRQYLCPSCNHSMERRQSRMAMRRRFE